jgi:hypothetical protein
MAKEIAELVQKTEGLQPLGQPASSTWYLLGALLALLLPAGGLGNPLPPCCLGSPAGSLPSPNNPPARPVSPDHHQGIDTVRVSR